jgi:hypothetical protein
MDKVRKLNCNARVGCSPPCDLLSDTRPSWKARRIQGPLPRCCNPLFDEDILPLVGGRMRIHALITTVQWTVARTGIAQQCQSTEVAFGALTPSNPLQRQTLRAVRSRTSGASM